jgi:hypothetical protein
MSALAVVIPCHRQERFLPRTIAALERALAGAEWRGVLVCSDADAAPLRISDRWRVLSPPMGSPLTPGASRMLGLAATGAEWTLFVDADVEIERAWVAAALAAATHGQASGFGGRLEEWIEDRGAARRGAADLNRVGAGERTVDHLTTPALYRTADLLAAGGYEPRLHSEEDFELGLRFRALGLRLLSLAPLAGKHWSGPRPSFSELGRRWRTGLCFGMGEVLRLYVGRKGLGTLLWRQRLYVATLAAWAAGAAALAWRLARGDGAPLALWATLAALALALMAARKRSLRLGLHAVLTWTVNAAGMVVGFVAPAARLGPGGRP